MKKFFLMVLCAFGVALASSVSSFEGFAEPFPVNDAKVFNGKLYLATDNGIRVVENSGESVLLTSANGLGSSEIASVAVCDGNLFAVSSKGIVSKLLLNGSFTEINRSYEESGTQAVSGVLDVGKNYIVIAFKNRLAFFDTKSGTFLSSVSRIGSVSLESNAPSAILISGDSLYVSLGNSVYVRYTDWENLKTDRLLVDPLSWKEINVGYPVKSMAIQNGKLEMRKESGSFYFKDGKKYAAAEDSSKIIAETEVTLPALYANGISKAKWILPATGENFFFAGSNFVGYGTVKSIKDYTAFSHYMLGGTYEMTALPNGSVLAAGLNSNISYYNGVDFSLPKASNPYGFSNNLDGPGHLIKALSVLPTGEVLYAVWGVGVFVFKDYTLEEEKFSVQVSDKTCIDNFLTDYMVIPSAVPSPDGSGFLITYWSKKNYGVAFVDLFGDVYCAEGIGTTEFSGAIATRLSDDFTYEIFVSVNTAQALNGNGSVDRFIMRSPKKGGELTVISKQNLATPDNGFPTDLAFSKDSVLWISTYSKLGYWNGGDSIQEPHRISQFSGTSLSSIAIDPHNNLWVASNGEGLFKLSRKNSSNDTLSAVRFKTRNGLLNDNIYDLALDSVSGTLWISHNVGITRMQQSDLRNASDYMTHDAENKVKVYPNPFRPKVHANVIFDFVSENARISIFNAGGKLVKSMANEDLTGGRATWNGIDDSGNLIAPGVYTYWITIGGKKKKQGRLLIIH